MKNNKNLDHKFVKIVKVYINLELKITKLSKTFLKG